MTCLAKDLCLWGTLCVLLGLFSPAHSVVAHEWCRYDESQDGRCLTESECAENHSKRPVNVTVYCGYEGDTRLVCCPLPPVTRPQVIPTPVDSSTIFTVPGNTAKQWCNYYKTACLTRNREEVFEQSQTTAVGEVLAKKNEFPHLAAIGYGSRSRAIWACSGSLISENFVLTSANCLQYGSNPAAWVRLGTVIIRSRLSKSRDVSEEGQMHPVISRIKHPGFKASSKYNDIALLKIGSALEANAVPTMSRTIHPACLQVDEEIKSTAIVTGWGTSRYGNDVTFHLIKLTTNILENNLCNQTFEKEIEMTQQLQKGIDESMICARSINTCQGESGGPLQTIEHDKSCLHKIVAVTSFVKNCGFQNSIAVYSRITAFIGWIEEQVWRQRESCSLDNGQYGECKLTSECTHILSQLGEGKKPVSCGFEGKEPIVCCPLTAPEYQVPISSPEVKIESEQAVDSRLPGETAKKWCNKYKSSCDSASNPEDNDEYPHLAFIGYGEEINRIVWACGGSLISENFVLTAAHCITDIEKKTAKWVRLGSQEFESDYRRSSNGTVIGQIHPILRIIPHPYYDESFHLNDLALLKIGVPVEPNAFSTLSSSIHPSCLQVSQSPISEAVGIGISEVGTGDHHPFTIQKASLNIVSNSYCNITAERATKLRGETDELLMCSQVASRERFLCTFNSEGPLQIPNHQGSCLYKTIGISTSGQLCGYNNGTIVYTRIDPHIRWIEDNVWP